MKLSNRLQAVLDLVPEGSVLADIGTDHGLLIVQALLTAKANFAYALDIAQKPLDSARKNVIHFGLEDKVSLELRNGLEGFTGNANCFVIAGMGAETILGIIKNYAFSKDAVIILQSNTKLAWLRSELASLEFEIIDEVFLIDKKIPTTIMKLMKRKPHNLLTLEDVWIGPILKKQNKQEYTSYLESRLEHLDTIKHHDELLRIEYMTIKNYLNK